MSPRSGPTRIEVLVLVGIVAMLAAVFAATYPSMKRAPLRNLRCLHNLKGIGNGFWSYSVGSADMFPVPSHAPAVDDGIGRVKYAPGKIGVHRGRADDPVAGETSETDTEMSTTRAFWYLIRSGACSPKSFICPYSDDQPNEDEPPDAFWDFAKYSEVSYGYQVPFGKRGQPGRRMPSNMVIAADKGPFGLILEVGGPPLPFPMPPVRCSGRRWSPWNSPNHEGKGQSVLYVDGRAEFKATPLAGLNGDNIYTRWQTPDGGTDALPGPRIYGRPPTGIETPFSDTDTLIYP